MRLPDSLPENVKDRLAVLVGALPTMRSTADPDDLLDLINARTRLATFWETDIPEAIAATKARLNDELDATDRELRESLFALGFSSYAPSVPANEKPGRWGGYLTNVRLTAITRALKALETFETEDVPQAMQEAHEAVRSVRQRLSRLRMAHA